MKIGKFVPKMAEFYAYMYDGKGDAPKVGKTAAKEGEMVIVESVIVEGEYIATDAMGNVTTKPTKTQEFKPLEIVPAKKFAKLNEGADDCGRDICSVL